MSAAVTCVFVSSHAVKPRRETMTRESLTKMTNFKVPTFYIPLYFQFVRGDSPLTVAVQLLPFIAMMIFFGLLNGALMSKFGYYLPW
jgi:threonine/homoserine/homoserine lactone efflux protein